MRYTAITSTALLAALLAASPAPADVPAKTLPMQAPAPPRVAPAMQAKAAVIVLYAYNGKKGIDERLPDAVKAKLKEPPFSAYNSYELVEQSDMALATDKPAEHALPNKDQLKLKLNGVAEKRYDVGVRIVRKRGEKEVDIVRIDAKMKKDELFFVAGPKYKDGILVLGLKVGPTK